MAAYPLTGVPGKIDRARNLLALASWSSEEMETLVWSTVQWLH